MSIPRSRPGNRSLESAYELADRTFGAIKTQADSYVSQMNSDVSADVIFNSLLPQLYNFKSNLEDAAQVQGIATYYSSKFPDYQGDIVAEFQATLDILNATIDWITTNMPVNNDGYLLIVRWNLNSLEWRVFPKAALAPLQSLLFQLAGSID